LEKVPEDPRVEDLRKIQSDHFEAVRLLKQFVKDAGDQSPEHSSAWAKWTKVIMNGGSLFNNRNALEALKDGEEMELAQYQSILNENIDNEIESLIRDKFIPQQLQHIGKIDRFIERLA
jgi:hypothetical protein